MHFSRWGLAALAVALAAAPAWSADLTKIERTLTKEPAYQSKTPKYCLLVFGPEAKTRIWLVADNDVLHVSNNQGDLTAAGSQLIPGQRFVRRLHFPIGDIATVDGKTQYT